jgi:hypothetical protein
MAFPVFAPGDVLNASDMNAVGMWLVKARTTFTAVASVSADNVFTADYTNYMLVFEYTTSGNAGPALQLRTGGVAATTGYNRQSAEFGGTTTTVARTTAQTSFTTGSSTNGNFRGVSTVLISRPALAEPTVFNLSSTTSFGAYTVPEIRFVGGNHETATAYDGFIVTQGSGQTITGAYTLYGMRD